MKTMTRRYGLTLLSLSVLTVCGGQPTEPDTTAANVSVTSPVVTLDALGQTATLVAAATTASGGPAVVVGWSWAVADPAVIAVDGSGVVTALANGSTTVTATADGVQGSVAITVMQIAATLVKVSGDAQFAVAGQPVDSALVLRADDALGTPVPAVSIDFEAIGGGSVSAAQVTTGADGTATVSWTAGNVAGVQSVVARMASDSTRNASFTGTVVAGAAVTLALDEGDQQTELPDHALPSTISVVVSDAFGNPVADAPVRFAAGMGSVGDTLVASDLNGRASTSWTLGASLGTQTSSANVDSVATGVTFTASAVSFAVDLAALPVLVAGDTVRVDGAGFAPDPTSNTVDVGGAAAIVVGGTQTYLDIVVPTFGCVAERSLALTVDRGVVSGQDSSMWRPAPALDLAVGERRVLSAPEGFCLPFASGANGDEYLIGVTSTADIEGEVAFALLGDDGVTMPVLPGPPAEAAASFVQSEAPPREAGLRAWERLAPRAVAMQAPAQLPPVINDVLDLRVPDLSGDVCASFTGITTTIVAVGSRFAIAIDGDNPVGEPLLPTHIAALLATAEGTLGPIFDEYVGAPSDLDGNERTLIVITQEVNRLGAVAGFATAADLFDRAVCASSDGAEILYLAAPDPAATVGAALSRAEMLAEAPVEIAHSMSHMVQFGQRLVAGSPLAEGWLAEGQAEVVVEAAAFAVLGGIAASDYGAAEADANAASLRWYGRSFEALARHHGWDGVSGQITGAPDRCSLFGFVGLSIACDDRAAAGAAWSFLRYLTDRFAASDRGGFSRGLLASSLPAKEAIATAIGVPFEEAVIEWAATLYMDGRLADGVAPDLEFLSWDLADVFEARPAEMRLTPVSQTFASFAQARSVVGGGTAYTLLGTPGVRGPMSLRVRTLQDGILGDELRPRVWVVRTR